MCGFCDDRWSLAAWFDFVATIGYEDMVHAQAGTPAC
jgi:hypothetical protein